MDQLNINVLLNRHNQESEIINCLNEFETNKLNLNLKVKRGVYVYGPPGIGKTYFVKDILKKLNYDIIKYDAGDIRNKNIIDTITKHNMSDVNVLSLFQTKKEKNSNNNG